MHTLNDIRTTFLDYFARHGHEVVASSPLVPRNDPTLMFTNAGMVQFKNVFTGAEKRPYSRAATSQKCVRAGGKHNDLDNVGYTARHHTFFEMLGNFSFGDYFKDVAIELAWNLITKEFQLDTKRLLVTVYSEDDEAAALWKKIAGFPESKIIRIPTSDNFWSMGDTGPCGPCSEIFYDYGDTVQGGPPGSEAQDGDRFVEFWNNVFMQFDQMPGGKRVPLPKPSIDTGMGLERMACVLQGVESVFQTDLFKTLIRAQEDLLKVKAEGEQAVLAAHPNAIICRTSWVYSPWPKNFALTMLDVGSKRDEVSVVSDQRGRPTYAIDLADALLDIGALVSTVCAADAPRILHLSNSGEATWHEFADAIFERAQKAGRKVPQLKAIPTSAYPTPAARPADARLDCTSAERLLGRPLRPWRAALDDWARRVLHES